MGLLTLFHILLFYSVTVVANCEKSNGVFFADMSRRADDWVPIAQCRADCLDGFGKVFGLTTSRFCVNDDECRRCWDDCACGFLKPQPPWRPQCSSDETCFAGCRRARSFVSYYGNGALVRNASSLWSFAVGTAAKLSDDDNEILVRNNTLVDMSGKVYSSANHLVFTVSILNESNWIQLEQPINFVNEMSLLQSARDCLHGCNLRTLVVNSTAILADVEFVFPGIPRNLVQSNLTAVLETDVDTSLQANLTSWSSSWKPKQKQTINETRCILKWSRLSVDGDTSRNLSYPSRNLSDSSDILPLVLRNFTYNSIYEIVVECNSTTETVQYQTRISTPACVLVDPGFHYCGDQLVSRLRLPNILVAVGTISVTLLVLSVLMWLWCSEKNRRKKIMLKNNGGNRAGLTTLCVPAGESMRLWDFDLADILLEATLSSTRKSRFSVMKGSFATGSPQKYVTVKRATGFCDGFDQDKRKHCLSAEFAALKTLRLHSSFVHTIGSAVDTGHQLGMAIIMSFEENSYGLDMLLRIYRKAAIITRKPGNETCLLPGFAFGQPGTAFMGALTARTLLTIAEQVASGVAFMNSRSLVHGALCANNVLCNWNFEIKIHGLSNVSNLDPTGYRTTYNPAYARYLPLEILQFGARAIKPKSDVWSFGVFLWEAITLGSIPYPTGNEQWLIKYLDKKYRLQQPPICCDEVYALMDSCWSGDYSRRPTMGDIHQKLHNLVLRNSANLIKLADIKALDDLFDTDVFGSDMHNDGDELMDDGDDDVFFPAESVGSGNFNLSTSARMTQKFKRCSEKHLGVGHSYGNFANSEDV